MSVCSLVQLDWVEGNCWTLAEVCTVLSVILGLILSKITQNLLNQILQNWVEGWRWSLGRTHYIILVQMLVKGQI